ncbi:MAG: RNA methyltransferase [Candidatus Falkowbacteria bacterium]
MQKLETIASLQNNQIKTLKKLALKKYRYELKQFTVENLTIICDALANGYDFETLFVTAEFMTRHLDKFQFLQENSQANYYIIDEMMSSHFSQLDTPSGITAIYKFPKNKIEDGESIIYLNSISDPGNLGTIMRTALAFNFNNLVLDGTCVDIYNAKTIAAAKNSIFKLNIFEDKDGSWISDTKLPIYVTSSHGDADLETFSAADKFCLVLGNESHGVSEAIDKLALKRLKIDISDHIESLNVSVAAAILFYKLGHK